MRLLAKSLTSGHSTPYAKAIALRDFLRNNFAYKLEAAPTPAHRESVDYFLFYLREGHCEYFASALAVLARCAGLPSRVATGFSPGNYNTLTTMFEIYEYHAHAWTQIYIPEYGWLTFDATPPSAVISETSPPGFGKMRDPFGDEWRVRPPELTDNTLDYMQKLRMQEERKKQGENAMEQTLSEIAAAGDKLKEELNKEHKKEKSLSAEKKVKKELFDMQALRLRVIELFKKFQQALIEFTLYVISSWTRLLAAVGALFAGAGVVFWLVRVTKKAVNILCFLWLCRRGKDFSDPRKALRSSCHAALALLALENMPRSNNQELLEYADSLQGEAEDCAREIFKLFYLAEYRAEAPGVQEAEKGAFQLERLRNCFKKRRISE